MNKFEARIHPRFTKNYWLEDTRTGEEFSGIVLVPGECASVIINQWCRGETFRLATLFLNFDTRPVQNNAEYTYYPSQRTRSHANGQPDGIIKAGEQPKLIIPGEDGDVFMPPIILKLFDSAKL